MSSFPLQYIDGNYSTPAETSAAPIVKRPFKDAIPSNLSARTIERRYLTDPRAWSPRLATRTSYTNVVTYSSDLSNAAWTKSGGAISPNAIANPADGVVNVGLFTEDAAVTTQHRLNNAFTGVLGTSYIIQAIVRRGTGSRQAQLGLSGLSSYGRAYFNLDNGTLANAASGTGGISYLGSGWYLIWLTAASDFSGTNTAYLALTSSTATNSETYSGDGTSSLYWYEPVVRAGTTPSPVISTTSAARTISVPDCDAIYNAGAVGADYFAFLTDETDVDTDSTAAAPMARTYSRVPAPQSKPISKFVDRPNLHGLKINLAATDRWAVSTDSGDTVHVFLTAARISCSAIPVTGGTYANIATVLHKVGHGLSVGDRYVAWSGDRAVGSGAVIFVFGADDFYISNDDITGGVGGITFYALQSAATVRYVQGAFEADCEETTTFYLLGYTPNGATTVSVSEDIPLVAKQMAPAAWFAVLEGYRASPGPTVTAVESTQGKAPYRGQIIGYTVTYLQVSDVYETQAV